MRRSWRYVLPHFFSVRLTGAMRTFALCAFLAIVSSQPLPSFAGPNEDAIAREALKVGAEQAARESAKQYINSAVTLPPTSSGAVPQAGTTLLSLVDLGLALNDLSKAETDKQKFYAGSRAGVAIYALAAGPGAPVVAVVLLVAALAESGLAAQHQKQMLEIYRRIAEYQATTIKITTEEAKAEAATLETYYLAAIDASATAESSVRYLKTNCEDVASLDSIKAIDDCLITIHTLVLAQQAFIRNADFLFTFDGTFLQGRQALESLSPGAGATFANYRTVYAKALESSVVQLQQLRDYYGDLAVAVVLKDAAERPVFDRSAQLRQICLTGYNNALGAIRLGQLRFATSTTRVERCSALRDLRVTMQQAELLSDQACSAAAAQLGDDGTLKSTLSTLIDQMVAARAEVKQLQQKVPCQQHGRRG